MKLSDVDRRRLDWIAIFLIAFLGRFAYWLVAGTRVVGDATDALAFCRSASLQTLLTSGHTLVYSGFQLPYCGFLYSTGGFVDGWVFLQIVGSAVSCVLLYETGRLLVDRLAGLVAGFTFAIVWEVFHWVVRPMSEPVFTIVVVVALWRLAAYETSPSRRNRALVVGALLYLGITRPNGLPIVAGYLLWDSVPAAESWRLNVFPRRSVNLVLVGILGILGLYRLVDGGAFVPAKWWADGLIVTGHVYYDFTPVSAGSPIWFVVSNIYHIVIIFALRALWFFSPVLPGWSMPHIALSLLTLFPLVVGGIVGSVRALGSDRRLFVHWTTPIAAIVLTAMLLWVAGSRNFLGPAVACYSLLTGYLVGTTRLESTVLALE